MNYALFDEHLRRCFNTNLPQKPERFDSKDGLCALIQRVIAMKKGKGKKGGGKRC